MNKNKIAIKTSKSIFHIAAFPRITSEGIEVINAMGIKTLKNNLRGKENEVKGNLPT